MFSGSKLPRNLLEAYSETHYEVVGQNGLTLVVDQTNNHLALAHDEYKVTCSAFITACNPFSRPLSAEENTARQVALAAELRGRSMSFLDGVGRHPSNRWEGEPSFLVFGLDLEAAKALGTQLEQNAIVWCGADATPRLILLQ